jgi:hypothetical protein
MNNQLTAAEKQHKVLSGKVSIDADDKVDFEPKAKVKKVRYTSAMKDVFKKKVK